MKKKTIIISSIAAASVIIAGLAIFLSLFIPYQNECEKIYQKANEHLYKYELDESEQLFSSIYNYRDSAAKIGVIHGIETLNSSGNYNKAIEATVEKGGVIEVAFTSEGTSVDPITITSNTIIDAKSYMEHYDFLKWNILSYYLIENSHSFQLNLYSSFTPHVYSIEYDVGDGFVVDPVRSYKYGTSVVATNAYQDGYTFTGYTVGDDETLYNPFVVKETDGQNFLLKAHYTPNTYTYHFDAMGGTTPIEEKSFVYGETYLIHSAYKEGYSFDGWYTDYDKKLEPVINIDDNLTLYAHYTPIEYHINYELYDGHFLETAPTGYNPDSEDITIPYPNKEGYLFLGWIKEDQDYKYSDINYTINSGSVGDITLHACYQKYESDYGNSYIKSLGDYSIPDIYPYDISEYIPGYVIPYNITSYKGNIFGDRLIHSFGVEKMNSFFDTLGVNNDFLVSKDHTSLYKMAFTSKDNPIDINLIDSITDIEEYAFAHAPIKSIASNNVINVKEGAFLNSSVESIDMPNVIIYEDKAFCNCNALINSHDSLLNATYFGDSSFYSTSLSNIVLGDKVTYLGPLSFGGTEAHHSLTYFECLSKDFDTMKNAFKGQTGTISLKLAKVVDSIKDIFGSVDVHLNNLDLVEVEDIPDEFLYQIPTFNSLTDTVDIVTVGDRAFYGAEAKLIPSLDKVTHIGESAFEKCPDILDVTLADIEEIGENAFKDSNLRKINLPDSLTSIGDGAFEGCENLEKIIIASPDLIEKIGSFNRLFGENTFAPKLDIEVRGEGTLPERAFQNLYVGKSVTLGDTVNLSKFAFNNATSIQYVYFNHDRNTIIPIGCFENASSLKEIDITNIIDIYSFAFNNCTSLEKITDQNGSDNTLGDSLKKVYNQAFGNLMKMETIYINNPSIEFHEAVFANNICEICVSNGVSLSAETLKDFQGMVWEL